MNLKLNIIKEINDIASRYREIEKIVLFGSRARGDNFERSDIDLAVVSSSTGFKDSFEFKYELETQTNTLLKFDITIIGEHVDKVLLKQLNEDGVIIYEKH